jgi:hypothetical protein
MRLCLLSLLVVIAACGAPRESISSFQAWLNVDAARGDAFERFSALMDSEGVGSVVPLEQLWMVDQLRPDCADSAFEIPPEDQWPNIVPALRFVRDHVEPAIGDVQVVSGFRTEAFNDCIGGASRSAHRSYQALDLTPVARSVTREVLIGRLCALHRGEGSELGIGLGIYSGVRFHVDARGYRGWGIDHRAGSFPCQAETRG